MTAATVALATACNDFISSPSAVENPNFPTNATSNQRLTGVEVNLAALQTGDPARIIALFTRQFAGTDRQYFLNAVFGAGVGEDLTNGYWSTIYGGGGLFDLREVKRTADEAGDDVTGGIARVIEAFLIGTAADWYGDVPYSQALDPSSKAALDPQASVYQAVQDTLSKAITQLGSAKGPGPGVADLFYGGDAGKWQRLAYTLKARYYLHTAERPGTAPDGTPNFDPAAYQSALQNAQQGIRRGEDFRSYQSANLNEANLLYQFSVVQRAGYVSPNRFFTDLLTQRNDPRLATYFAPGTGTTTITGSTERNGGPTSSAAVFNPGAGGLGSAAFRWPIVSYAENQLIIAEAQFRLGSSADALTAYNAARTANGLPTLAALPAGAAGLQEIITEKYVTLVQNPEVWNDYKRTCYPQITASPQAGASGTISARFLYPDIERNANAANVPPPEAQNPRNPNDPNPCTIGTRQTSD